MHDIFTLIKSIVQNLLANQTFVTSTIKDEILNDVYTKEQTEEQINTIIANTLNQLNEEIIAQSTIEPTDSTTIPFYTKEEVDAKIAEAIASTLQQINNEINN